MRALSIQVFAQPEYNRASSATPYLQIQNYEARTVVNPPRFVFVSMLYISSRDLGLGCGRSPGLTPDYYVLLSTLTSYPRSGEVSVLFWEEYQALDLKGTVRLNIRS